MLSNNGKYVTKGTDKVTQYNPSDLKYSIIEEELLSRLSQLTMRKDLLEFSVLRSIIDEEIRLEDMGFNGSQEDLFKKAIENIGVKKVVRALETYNTVVARLIEPAIDAVETDISLIDPK